MMSSPTRTPKTVKLSTRGKTQTPPVKGALMQSKVMKTKNANLLPKPLVREVSTRLTRGVAAIIKGGGVRPVRTCVSARKYPGKSLSAATFRKRF
jgi:hypothetical protein